MTGDWQDIAALGIVLGAFAYLLRFTRGLSGSGGSGGGCHSGCGGCPVAKPGAKAPDGFVSLDGLRAASRPAPSSRAAGRGLG